MTTWGGCLASGRRRAKAQRRGRKPAHGIAGESSRNAWPGQLVDGRHLGHQQIPILFAEDRVKRPSAPCVVGTAQADRPQPSRARLRAVRLHASGAARRSAASGPPASRERVVRGPREPNAFSREQGSCGGIVGDVASGASRAARLRAQTRENGRAASRSIGVSSRCSRGSTTRGVRVDRVGVKLRHRALRSRRPRRLAGLPAQTSLGGGAGRLVRPAPGP